MGKRKECSGGQVGDPYEYSGEKHKSLEEECSGWDGCGRCEQIRLQRLGD